jgi:hypothetical protein
MFEWLSRLPWLWPQLSATALTLLAAYLTYRFARRQFRYQKLIGLYADFVGVASDDLEWAKGMRAAVDCNSIPPTDDDGFARWRRDLVERDAPRHQHRKDMFRISLQIQILDRDKNATQLVQKLCKSQPWFFYQPYVGRREDWVDGARHKEEDRYKRGVDDYSNLLDQLFASVCVKYGN